MRSVLVLRQQDDLSRILETREIPVINCPVIQTESVDDLTDLEKIIDGIDDFDAIFITSHSAAGVLVRYAEKIKAKFRGRLIILGRRSFDILKDTGLELRFDDRASSASELLDVLGIESFRGSRVLFIRGERSLRTIPERLSGIARVEEATGYRTIDFEVPGELKESILRDLDAEQIGMVCFFSPSGIESFDRQIGLDRLANVSIGSIGETTALALRERGVQVHLIASISEGSVFAAEVVEYLRKRGGGTD